MTGDPGTMTRACFPTVTAKSQGSFARRRVLPASWWHFVHLEGHYSLFLAYMSPCAEPNPSRWLRLPIPPRPCRLSPIPAGRWFFPTLLPVLRARSPGPMPRGSLLVHSLVTSQEASASRYRRLDRLTGLSSQCNFDEALISGLQSFTNVQALHFWLAWPSDCTHRNALRRPAAGPFTPRRTCLVTQIR